MPKALRLAIWVNGLASLLLVMSLAAIMIAGLNIPNLPSPPNLTLVKVATPLAAVALVMFSILGSFMVVMEILSRKRQ